MSTKETLKALQAQASKELAAAEREIAQLGPKYNDIKARYEAAVVRREESRQHLRGFAVSLGETFNEAAQQVQAQAAPAQAQAQAAQVKAPAVVQTVKTAPKAPAKGAKPAPKAAPKAVQAKVKTGGDVAPKAKAPVAQAQVKTPAVTGPKKADGKPAPKKLEVKAPVDDKARTTKAAEGRRAVAQGLRPTMAMAIASVMGDETMHSAQILPLLKAKGWLPNASSPSTYIAHAMSTNDKVFTRQTDKGRGYYKVTDDGKAKVAAALAALENNGKAVVSAEIPGPTPKQDVAAKPRKNGQASTPTFAASGDVNEAMSFFGGAPLAPPSLYLP